MADEELAEYNGNKLVTTAIFFLVVTYISVSLRTLVRTLLTRNFFADDFLMVVAQVIFTLSCSFILTGVTHGLGKHNQALSPQEQIQPIMWQALATATYVLNMMFIKLSIAVFLLRLSAGHLYAWILWTSMTITTVWSIVLFFWDVFQCKPVTAQWDFTIENAQCVTVEQIVSAAYALSVMSILTDWLYALLPIPMVWNVRMTVQEKVTVVVILGLGVFASVATLIRLKFLADLTDTEDILFAGTDAMVWTLIEPGVAITASSLVTIRPLLRAMRVQGFQSTEGSKNVRTDGKSGGGVVNSTTQRSAGGVPGVVNQDITLIDVELEAVTSKTETIYGAGNTCPDLPLLTHQPSKGPDRHQGYLVPSKPVRDTEDRIGEVPRRREEIVMDGGSTSGREQWLNEWDRRPSTAQSEMSDDWNYGWDFGWLDEQSQHSGRMGLGVPRCNGNAAHIDICK